MNLQTYEFQTEAIDEIVSESIKLFKRKKPGILLLEAPTGAGKTVIAALALAKIAEIYLDAIVFIWLAPNTLHDQSRQSLLEIYGGSKVLSCITGDELVGGAIDDRTVLFLNWSSVNKKENKLRRDDTGTETGSTLAELIAATKVAGKKVMLIVDESHRDVNGEQAQIVVNNIICPDLTLEISATPILEKCNHTITIDRNDVEKEGVIRKQFVVNPGLSASLAISDEKIYISDSGTAEVLLAAALAHRAKIANSFTLLNKKINPLILIQLPDKGEAPNDVLERIADYLQSKHGVSESNGKVAVWLSEKKINLLSIESPDSLVEILFFKQAIAVGWNCPRAQVLVSLREMKSPVFTAQVLGRILRQPEHMHYNDDLLDSAYIFTNYHELTVAKEFESILATILVTKQLSLEIPLTSEYEVNTDQRMYLTESSYKTILGHAHETQACVLQDGPIKSTMLTDLTLVDIDVENDTNKVTYSGQVEYVLGEEQLEQRLNEFTRSLVAKTASQIEGRKFVRRALLEAARQKLPKGTQSELITLILHDSNKSLFETMVLNGLAQLAKEFNGKVRAFGSRKSWTPPHYRVLRWSQEIVGLTKSVYTPVLANEFTNTIEQRFALYLDSHPNVKAWLKNGNTGVDNFSLMYKDQGVSRLFFPDFVAELADGSYGIWDTKGHGSNGTANLDETAAKADALQSHIKKKNNSTHPIKGGIVVLDDNGVWVLNEQPCYTWSADLKGWKRFSL